jgi:hypothetical protein
MSDRVTITHTSCEIEVRVDGVVERSYSAVSSSGNYKEARYWAQGLREALAANPDGAKDGVVDQATLRVAGEISSRLFADEFYGRRAGSTR